MVRPDIPRLAQADITASGCGFPVVWTSTPSSSPSLWTVAKPASCLLASVTERRHGTSCRRRGPVRTNGFALLGRRGRSGRMVGSERPGAGLAPVFQGQVRRISEPPSRPGAECGKAVTWSRGSIGSASERAGRRAVVRMTRPRIQLENRTGECYPHSSPKLDNGD